VCRFVYELTISEDKYIYTFDKVVTSSYIIVVYIASGTLLLSSLVNVIQQCLKYKCLSI